MKSMLFALCLLISLFCKAQENKAIYSKAKIYYNSPDDLQKLLELGIPVDHGALKKNVFLISEFSKEELKTVKAAGFQVDILIEDAKAHFLKENKYPKGSNASENVNCSQTQNYPTPTNFELGSMGGYLTYQELLDELDEMRSLYPNLISARTGISNFVTNGQPDNATTPNIGGNAIQWVRISDNPETSTENEPQILYSAVHHAREPISLSQLVYYMWYLLENYDSSEEVQGIINNTELYFVPVVNPDGYLYNEKTDPNGGGFWRKNRFNGHGIDNNRNYDYYINGDSNNNVWNTSGTDSNPNGETYAGTGPFSEVENQAMKWFVEEHDFVVAFNNHTSGDLLLYPFGYANNAPTPDNSLYQTISEELVSQSGFDNIISADLYPAAGDSDDFMYGTVNTHDKIFTFTPEIGPSFWPPSNQIDAICKGMMYTNITGAKMASNYAVVEDQSTNFISSTAVNIPFNIKRLGLIGTGDFTVSLVPVSANITSVGNPVAFSGLDILEEDSGNIQLNIETSIQAGSLVEFNIVVDNGLYAQTTGVSKVFGNLTPVLEDDGSSVTENFNTNGWQVTTDDFVSPPSSITDSPNGNYSDNTNISIELNTAIDLSEATVASLSFKAKWDIENNWDYTQIEISTDNGNSWTPQCGSFTNAGSSNSGQPTGEPLYDGTQNTWITEEISLSDYLGESILVRFQFESDGGIAEDGFYFDDFTISIIGDSTLSVTDFENSQFNIFPNPVSSQLQVLFNGQDQWTYKIYTLRGQVIESGQKEASATLDFSNIASGVYFIKVYSKNSSETFRVLKE